ncbi:hypothetical protein IKP85_05955 [bacterium]|nr:hypothetical protein [bacterium]
MLVGLYKHDNYNQQFTSRLPEGVFRDVRYIPHIRCALCDKFMMSYTEINEFIEKIPKIITREDILREIQSFDDTKHDAARYLIKLINTNPKKGWKSLVTDNNVLREIMQMPKDTQDNIVEIVQHINKYKKNLNPNIYPSQIIPGLKRLKKLLPEGYSQFIEILDGYSKKFPHKSFKEIINDKVFINYHRQIANSQGKSHKLHVQSVTDRILNLGKKLPYCDRLKLKELNKQAAQIAGILNYSPDFRRALINELYAEFLQKNVENRLIRNQYRKYISSIPLRMVSGDDIFLLLKNGHKDNDIELIKDMFAPVLSSFEHAVPKSQDGKNTLSNGIFMHAACNNARNTMSYERIITIFPAFAKYVQNQVSRVTSFIKSGQLKGYSKYPVGIRDSLLEASNGKLKINVRRYIREMKAKTLRQIEQDIENLEENRSQVSEIDKQVAELLSKKESLEQEFQDGNKTLAKHTSLVNYLNKEENKMRKKK